MEDNTNMIQIEAVEAAPAPEKKPRKPRTTKPKTENTKVIKELQEKLNLAESQSEQWQKNAQSAYEKLKQTEQVAQAWRQRYIQTLGYVKQVIGTAAASINILHSED